MEVLFNAYKKNRRQHFQNLAEEEVSQRNNIKGWLNRDDRFTYIK
ncbi:putative peptidoglycan-binding domain-containing protein [Coprobacter tertius]